MHSRIIFLFLLTLIQNASFLSFDDINHCLLLKWYNKKFLFFFFLFLHRSQHGEITYANKIFQDWIFLRNWILYLATLSCKFYFSREAFSPLPPIYISLTLLLSLSLFISWMSHWRRLTQRYYHKIKTETNKA